MKKREFSVFYIYLFLFLFLGFFLDPVEGFSQVDRLRPPHTIEVLSKAAKVTRPNHMGPVPCGCEFNTFTGNVFIQRPLFAIPSRGPDLAFTLVYNSGNTDLRFGFGNGWTANYNLIWERPGNDSLLVHRGDGRVDAFTFDGAAYHAPAGITDTLVEISPDVFVLETKYGKKFYFENKDHRRLTKIIDRNDNELRFTYSDSLLIQIRDDSDRNIQFEYENGLLFKVTESNTGDARSVLIEHDGNGNLRRITDPMGYSWKYVYDIHRNIIQVTDPNGNHANLEYNQEHAVTVLHSAVSAINVEYDTENAETIVIEPVGGSEQITRYGFNGAGNVAYVMGACCGFDVQYEYDNRNNISKITDANGGVYEYTYTPKGNVSKETDPLGNEQFFAWTADFSQMSYWKDKNGCESSCEFDANGNVTIVHQPSNITRSYTWTPSGLLAISTDAEGNVTTFDYDTYGNRIATQYPIGAEHFDFDDIGNRTFSVTPNGDTTRYEYDRRNMFIKSTDPLGNSLELRYDGNRNRIWSKNKRGYETRYFYNANNQMVKMAEPLDVVTEYGYDEKGNRIYMKDPNGNESFFTFDEHNLLVEQTNANGDKQSWEYDPIGNMKKRTNYLGNSSTSIYDKINRVIEQTDALGFTTKYSYDANGNNTETSSPDDISSFFEYDCVDRLEVKQYSFSKANMTYYKTGNLKTITDAGGNTTEFFYDGNNRLVMVKDALSQQITYEYDDNGNRTKVRDKKLYATDTVFDRLGRPIIQINALGDSTLIAYDENGNRISVRNERGYFTEFEYDLLDRLVKITHPENIEETYEYDKNGNRTKEVDGEGNATVYKYNELNQLDTIVYDDNSMTIQTYDEQGNTLTRTNEEGETTIFAFDAKDRLISVTNPENETTSYEYNSLDQLTATILPSGNEIQNVHDSEGRVVSTYDKLGAINLKAYSDDGELIRETDANNNSLAIEYDALHRLIKTTDAMGEITEIGYDPNDNQTSTKDRNGNITLQDFDELNRLASQTEALGFVTTYEYDETSNLKKITDEKGNQTSFAYDGKNRLIKETFPDNTTKEYTYDKAGNLETRKDNKGDITNYTYDNRNRLIFRNYPGSNDDSFAYDDAGRMVAASNAHANVSFLYDMAGRRTAETLNGKTTAYAYNIPNRTRTLFYPGGKMVAEERDERNRIINIASNGPEAARWYYDAANLLMARTYANGIIARYTRNENDWITKLEHANPSGVFAAFNYVFDKEGNKEYEEKIHRPDRSEKYDYDDNYRLTGFKRGELPANTFSIEKTFNYDALGNRVSVEENGMITTYVSNGMNEYTSISGQAPPQHDENGNLTFDGSHTYQYDHENRMTVVDGGTTAVYKYDPLGRRIKKETINEVLRFFFDGAREIEETDDSGMTKATYDYGTWIDDVLVMERDGEKYFYHHNSLGSVIAVSDENGNPAEFYEYDAYGVLIITNSSGNILPVSDIENPFFFTNRRLDTETGLYYFRARYYDDNYGRFLKRDPLGYQDGLNLYEYVRSNPCFYLDPMGLRTIQANFGFWYYSTWRTNYRLANFLIGVDFECSSDGDVNLTRAFYGITEEIKYGNAVWTPSTTPNTCKNGRKGYYVTLQAASSYSGKGLIGTLGDWITTGGAAGVIIYGGSRWLKGASLTLNAATKSSLIGLAATAVLGFVDWWLDFSDWNAWAKVEYQVCCCCIQYYQNGPSSWGIETIGIRGSSSTDNDWTSIGIIQDHFNECESEYKHYRHSMYMTLASVSSALNKHDDNFNISSSHDRKSDW